MVSSRRGSRRSAIVTALALLAAVLPSASSSASIEYPNTERIDASSAVEAGIAVSQRLYDQDAAGAAILTRTDKFPDGLAASALSAAKDAPVLFTPTDHLDPATRAEIDRVLPDGAVVYLLGGPLALSQAVEDAVEDAGYRPVRIGGDDRIDTAANVARFFVGAGPDDTAFVLRGFGLPGADETQGWVDAVSCGGYAARTGTPVLLTNTNEDRLPQRTVDVLNQLDIRHAIVCGGPHAVPNEHAAHLVEMGIQVSRYAGDTRVTTAIDVARRLWGHGRMTDGDSFVLVNGFGANFAYGIAAAPLSGATRAPILLVDTDDPASWPVDCGDPPTNASRTLCHLHGDGDGRVASLVALGSTSLIADAVLEAAAQAGGIPRDTQPPTVPTGVAGADHPEDDGTGADVSWQASTDDSGSEITYTVYVRESAEEAMTTANSTDAGSVTDATSLTVGGLTAGTEYEVAVTATDPFGRTSELSDPATVTPTDEVPSAPVVEPNVQQTGPTTVTLAWSAAPEADADGYVIQRGSPGEDDPTTPQDESCADRVLLFGTDYGDVGTVDDRDTTVHEDGGVQGGQEYCYRYVVLDTTGNRSDPSPAARIAV